MMSENLAWCVERREEDAYFRGRGVWPAYKGHQLQSEPLKALTNVLVADLMCKIITVNRLALVASNLGTLFKILKKYKKL
jgi:hypothetical protein